MRGWIKRGVAAVVVLLIVAVVGMAVFVLSFDPNAYKGRLQDLVWQRYHRHLVIRGDIGLSLFPRIGLSVSQLSLSNRERDDVFASVDSARLAVAIWPLFFSRLVVDHVAISGFRAWIVREADGRFNFRDLLPGMSRQNAGPAMASVPTLATVAPRSAPAERMDFQIDIAGLDLRKGEVHFLDRHAVPRAGRIRDLSVRTGRMTFDQPFDVTLSGHVDADAPQVDAQLSASALLRLDPRARQASASRSVLRLEGRLGPMDTGALRLQGDLAYDEYSRMIKASGVALQFQGQSDAAPSLRDMAARLSTPELYFDGSRAALKLSKLTLDAHGTLPDGEATLEVEAPAVSISPQEAGGEPISAAFTLASESSQLALALELSQLSGNAYGLQFGKMSMEAQYAVDKVRRVGVSMSSPVQWRPFVAQGGLLAMKGDVMLADPGLPEGEFAFPFIGSLQADLFNDTLSTEINAVMQGSKIDLNVATSQWQRPGLAFDLSAEKLDLNAFFPALERGEHVSASIAAPIPDAALLNAVRMVGRVTLGTVVAGDAVFDHVQADIAADAGRLQLNDLRMGLGNGQVTGSLSLDPQGALAFDLKGHNVPVDPVLDLLAGQRCLAGAGEFAATLQTHGQTTAAWAANLDGALRLSVRDGALAGVDLAHLYDAVRQPGRVRSVGRGRLQCADAAQHTDFSQLDMAMAFRQGQGHLQEVMLRSPAVRVRGRRPANLDLVNGQIDLLFDVVATPSADAPADKAGLRVPVRLSGPLDEPGYAVQWAQVPLPVVKDVRKGKPRGESR